jgi:NADH-quinone oxidoreductase subunit N
MYITAFFAIFVKFILFIVFVRVASHFNSDTLLNIFIIFSLLVGCFMSINQTEIKRLLAYSSIVHVAFLFMGDIASSLIYLLTYAASSLILFSVLLTVQLGGKELIYLNDLKFVRSSGYFNTGCLVIALASSAGLPPFAGFYGKFLVWSSLIEDIYLTNSIDSYIILFLSIAISLVTIFYYMRVIAYLFIGEDTQSRSTDYSVDASTFNGIARFQITTTAVLVF